MKARVLQGVNYPPMEKVPTLVLRDQEAAMPELMAAAGYVRRSLT